MVALVCFMIGLAGFLVHWAVRGRHWTDVDRLEHAVRWWFAAGGAWLFVSGVGHVMIPDEIAETIGWPAGSPFQREVGFTDLAWGILGLLSVLTRGSFREAYVIGTLVFLSGVMLYVDIFAPVVNAALLWRLRAGEWGALEASEVSLRAVVTG